MAKRKDWHQRQKKSDELIYKRCLKAIEIVRQIYNDDNVMGTNISDLRDIEQKLRNIAEQYRGN